MGGIQALATGIVVAIVGFFSSFPIFLAGVEAMGATEAQAASALMAGAIAMGVAGIGLALWRKIPASCAWSTPGAALLAASVPDQHGFAGAVGAFLVAGALVVLSGLWRPLVRLAQAVPGPITQAMLAGVLLPICLAPFRFLPETPVVALVILLTWFIVGRFSRLFAVPAAVLATLALTYLELGHIPVPDHALTAPVWVTPAISLSGLISLALPLFIVTMATQNMPGISVLKSNGYAPSTGPFFVTVGAISILSAPFGAIQTNLAAITAAMCAGDSAHPDKAQRYWAAVWAGILYVLFGIFAAVVTYVASQAPLHAMEILAGVALIGVFTNSAAAAWKEDATREAAALTFVITASGLTLWGIGGAVWGLLAGCLMAALRR
ncbi:benzoate/H(+) symporter BenE family transporter [Pseudoprimorskyibacter insulae]|uniref:Inner membrane protein YdcO n=1 Tax=Pseudoprimorskyibacter insulae TaxID=1695997 RepID=A0A2R8AUY8_9RHOB|nr:benzoate/H(+) symporter BenE family transporter [Pseudoprimorskyibacter insulae]SPF79843.1 Inner membrane protein YdcO [Pseudoprimorskyibacter insulae]